MDMVEFNDKKLDWKLMSEKHFYLAGVTTLIFSRYLSMKKHQISLTW